MSNQLASAVALPDEPSSNEPIESPTADSSNALKRPQPSSAGDEVDSKRARVEFGADSPSTLTISNTEGVTAPGSRETPTAASGNKSSSRRPIENDKGRNKRLFGGLFGAAGGLTGKRTDKSDAKREEEKAQRRAEIDERQREKLRRQSQPSAELTAEEMAEIQRIRELEQPLVEEQCRRTKQQNDAYMARFYKTRAEPPVFWRPAVPLSEGHASLQERSGGPKPLDSLANVPGDRRGSFSDMSKQSGGYESASPKSEGIINGEMPEEHEKSDDAMNGGDAKDSAVNQVALTNEVNDTAPVDQENLEPELGKGNDADMRDNPDDHDETYDNTGEDAVIY